MNIMEEGKSLSAYHFDSKQVDKRFDTIVGLGRFEGDWADEVAQLVENSRSVSPGTAGSIANRLLPPSAETIKKNEQFFRTTQIDYDRYPVLNKSLDVGPKVQKMIDAFKLGEPGNWTVHVQLAGQVVPYHFDFWHLSDIYKDIDPKKLIRIQIMLTDWEPGHMMGYGGYLHTRWRAGDIVTFAHAHVPHYTANATYNPRVNVMLTGVRTAETDEFLWEAYNKKTIKVDELK